MREILEIPQNINFQANCQIFSSFSTLSNQWITIYFLYFSIDFLHIRAHKRQLHGKTCSINNLNNKNRPHKRLLTLIIREYAL